MDMRIMLYQYQRSLKEARKMLQPFEKKKTLTEQDEIDKKLINEIIRDLEYTVEWLTTGRQPGSRRGIDRHDAYIFDPDILYVMKSTPLYEVVPQVFSREDAVKKELSVSEKEIIADALCKLTKKERDVFTLIRCEGLTFEYTGELLGITKSSVQTYLERAEKKIQRRKSESLFLVS